MDDVGDRRRVHDDRIAGPGMRDGGGDGRGGEAAQHGRELGAHERRRGRAGRVGLAAVEEDLLRLFALAATRSKIGTAKRVPPSCTTAHVVWVLPEVVLGCGRPGRRPIQVEREHGTLTAEEPRDGRPEARPGWRRSTLMPSPGTPTAARAGVRHRRAHCGRGERPTDVGTPRAGRCSGECCRWSRPGVWSRRSVVAVSRTWLACSMVARSRRCRVSTRVRAGALRRTVPDTVAPVHATVAETALRRGGAVVTSDWSDIEQLASAARRRIQLIDV